ncbi:MAG: VOC family protein [Aliidongia sp.]
MLRVADKPRALRFYIDVLGLTLEREQPKIGLTQLRAGASLIDLVPADGAAVTAPNMDHFALEIIPYDEAALRRYPGAARRRSA